MEVRAFLPDVKTKSQRMVSSAVCPDEELGVK